MRGQEYAVSSMKAQATAAAVEILDAGGNAFDAVVAGQAVLALVDPASNGIGADAVVLVYDAEGKEVFSINAEGMAPALATIEWYEEHNNAELPRSDGLLAASTPGVVDAWYILLDRWGTMTFEQTLRRAIAVAAEGFPRQRGAEPDDRPLGEDPEVPDDHEGLRAGRPRAGAGRDLPQSRRRPRAGEDRRGRARERSSGPVGGAEGGPRPLLQGRHRAGHGQVLRGERRPLPLRGLRRLHRPGGDAGLDELPRLRGLQEPVGQPGPGRAVHPEHPGGLRPRRHAPQQRRLRPHERRGAEAGLRRPREVPRRPGRRPHSLRGAAVEGLRGRAPRAGRPGQGVAGVPAGHARAVHGEPAADPGPPARHVRGGRRSRGRHQLHRGGRRRPQHGELRAQPAQRLRHRGGRRRSRVQLHLPGRLLLAGPRRGQRPGAGQAAAQHAAEHAGDEGRRAVGHPRQPGRRRPDHADHADPAEHGGVQHERAAGDRGAALVDAQLPGVAVPAHHVPRRPVGGAGHLRRGARGAGGEGPRVAGPPGVVDGLERRHRRRPRARRAGGRRRPRTEGVAWAK